MTSQLFTPEQIKEDGRNRVSKTGGQSGVASAIILCALWLAHQAGWHGEMPADVALGFGVILTTIGAVVTNFARLKGRG